MDDLRKALTDFAKCSTGKKRKGKDEEMTKKSELVVSLAKSGPMADRRRQEKMVKLGMAMPKTTGKFAKEYLKAPNRTARQKVLQGQRKKAQATIDVPFSMARANGRKSFEGIPDLSKSFSTDVIPLHIRNATVSSPINALRRK